MNMESENHQQEHWLVQQCWSQIDLSADSNKNVFENCHNLSPMIHSTVLNEVPDVHRKILTLQVAIPSGTKA